MQEKSTYRTEFATTQKENEGLYKTLEEVKVINE